ncbi:hypothetical protein [Winogradskyella vidalii]|uniref:hypothetical protein n=1 Tax=Winogradskyella vidalii TaxID=2615024 RepID=UPI0015C98C38|nr:hypothetical protein [Winogradskyella vidalii]
MEIPKRQWKLNPNCTTEMSVQEKKDAYLLVLLLNQYGNYNETFEAIKKDWLNLLYSLPSTKDKKAYNSVKSSRSYTMLRLKSIFKNYIIQSK